MEVFVKKTQIVKEEMIIVGRAEYIPIPEFDNSKKSSEEVNVEQTKGEQKVTSESSVITKNNKDESSSWEYKKPEKIDTSWREKITNLMNQKKKTTDNLKPIEISKTKTPESERKQETNSNIISNEGEREVMLYSKKMQAVIRNHWSVPEDIALKYGNSPVEVEIEIDITGNLKGYRLKNSSGNNVYDASIKEAIRKSFPFLPPPKNLFQTPFESAKITIIFRL